MVWTELICLWAYKLQTVWNTVMKPGSLEGRGLLTCEKY